MPCRNKAWKKLGRKVLNSYLIWKSSVGHLPLWELQVNSQSYNGIKCNTLTCFSLYFCHALSYSLSDRINLLLFPSSFSVVLLQPSPAWIPHRTRVERTVSFVHMSVSDMTEES